MKEFVLIFRQNGQNAAQPSPEEMQQVMTRWMDWLGQIAAQGKMVDKGNRLGIAGSKTVLADTVTDGPYSEIREMINGYTIVRAQSVEDAVALAQGCPVLMGGGSVEVRPIVSSDDNS